MEELGIFSGMEEENKGMSRSNPPKIIRRAERKYSLLMRLLRSRTKSMIRHSTNDGGSSFGESPSSSAETLKTEPIPSVAMDDSALMRFMRSRTELMIQNSTNAGFGGSETLKTEQTPSMNSILMRFLPSRTKPMIQQSTNDGFGGSSSSELTSSPAETWKTEPTPSVSIEKDVLTIDAITVDELMTADFSDFDGFSKLERQFSQENLQLLPTHFPSRDRAQGRKMCREFLRTGRCCSMGTMCSFSHQPPVLQPEQKTPQINVAIPRLFVPTSPLRPLQPQRMPLRQFLQQTASPPESPREETACSNDSASSSTSTAATDAHSSSTTTKTDTKVNSLTTGDIGTIIPSISALSAALTTAQTPKSSDKAGAEGSVSVSRITISPNAKVDSSPKDNACTEIPSISKPSTALPQRQPAQEPKSSTRASGSTPQASTTAAGSSTTTTTAGSGDTSRSAPRASTTDKWSPMDDGIAINLPCSSSSNPPSREDVNRYIDWFLYNPDRPRNRRLPVFQAICNDNDD